MKKIKICILTIMIVLFGLNSIYGASELIDMDYSDSAYKFSDSGIINLPFFRVSSARITMDKDINKSGISMAKDTIDVTNSLKGIQTLISIDTVRVTGNMEYGLIMAPTVIIEGNIDKTLLIISDNITFTDKAKVKEDIIVSCNKLDIAGTIEGNLIGTCSDVNITGNIQKDFRVRLNNLKFGDNSKILGNVYIEAYNNIDIKTMYPNATIKILEKVENENNIDIFKIIRTSLLFSLIYLLLSTKTNIIKNMLEKIKKHRIATIVVSIFSMLLLPLILTLVIFITLIGLGIISLPILFSYITFLIVTFTLSSLIVGSVMSEYISNKYIDKLGNFWTKLVLSFVIFTMISLIPFIPIIGYTLSLAVCMISSGIVFTSIFRKV
ncbi:MAG: hypothetical protein RR144_00005 [Clostridia bacterium]